MSVKPTILDELECIVGTDFILREGSAQDAFLREWRGRIKGKSPAVLLPHSAEQIQAIMRIAIAERIPVVPQSGNTGLVGGGVPDESGTALCVSLKHINRTRHVDADDFSMVAEAGCILHNAQEAAGAENRLLGITLASEGSACIGGLIATNAGGAFTLRYGTMRAQVMGLEAVLPDGTLWNGLKSLHKNNSGYDLKQFFIGCEGTLGVITAATLRLYPKPTQIETALVALPSAAKAIQLLGILRAETQDALAAFELMPALAIETASRYVEGVRAPFTQSYPWVALIETHETSTPHGSILEGILAMLAEKGLLLDAVLAQSVQQQKAFWTLREAVVEGQKHLGASLKHDLSVPVGNIPALISAGSALAETLIPGVRPYTFGHVGDGNIHFNLSQPEGMDTNAFLEKREKMAGALHDLTLSLGGSISAEHGIGRFKRAEFHRTASEAELMLMRKIKASLDPHGIMNPGVML